LRVSPKAISAFSALSAWRLWTDSGEVSAVNAVSETSGSVLHAGEDKSIARAFALKLSGCSRKEKLRLDIVTRLQSLKKIEGSTKKNTGLDKLTREI
jgi:hypothetical protein